VTRIGSDWSVVAVDSALRPPLASSIERALTSPSWPAWTLISRDGGLATPTLLYAWTAR
jgi:hypothetical protein